MRGRRAFDSLFEHVCEYGGGMSIARPYLPPQDAREAVLAALDAIDAAHAQLRKTSTDLVGNAFRVEVAVRLERQQRFGLGQSYRMFGELADPPDGLEAPGLGAGPSLRDTLTQRLHITAAELRRRFRLAARITPRRSLTGPPRPPELPELAAAVADGAVGEDHIREVYKALDALPAVVTGGQKDWAEGHLVRHAREQDRKFVELVGARIADRLNPDGIFDERDRANRRFFTLGRQGPDGMSKVTGRVTPELRAYLEALGAAVRPGHHLPGSEQPVVDGATDTRTPAQRMHDAVAWGLRAGIESGTLGTHRGIPVTVIVNATLEQLVQAARAAVDPSVPMPGPARTAGGTAVPMRDLIRMASHSVHYLAVFDGHSERPLYLGRSRRIATVDQRIACHARDKGCTRPNCTVWGYECEVHHTPDWDAGGATDADQLHFGCGPDHALATDGHATTTVTDDGRLAWAIGDEPPWTNPVHHDAELFDDPPDRP